MEQLWVQEDKMKVVLNYCVDVRAYGDGGRRSEFMGTVVIAELTSLYSTDAIVDCTVRIDGSNFRNIIQFVVISQTPVIPSCLAFRPLS